MRSVSRFRKITLIALALIVCQALLLSFFGLIPARAQNTGIATVGPLSFSTSTCNGMVQTFQPNNLGQSVHFVNYSAVGLGTATGQLRVFITSGGVAISDYGTDPNGGIITANGYQNVLINVICSGGSTPTVTLSYTGTSANSVPVTGTQDQSSWFKPIVFAAAENTTQTFATLIAPYGNTCGQIFFIPAQGANIGTISISTTGLTSFAIASFPVAPANAVQIFNVPCQPAQGVQATFTQNTGSGTYSLYYAFYKPGLFPNLSTPNSGTSSTLPIQVISDSVDSAYSWPGNTTNPGTGATVLMINDNQASKSLYFDKAILTCSAACTVVVGTMTGCSSCTASSGGATNLKELVSPPSSIAATTVGTPSGNAQTFTIGILSGQSVILDIRGVIAPSGTNAGVFVQNVTSFTGTLWTSLTWYER